ncbi:unnamed protein product [Effrenium voratum]|nr:unnamed protein product [Effrenium voratum]
MRGGLLQTAASLLDLHSAPDSHADFLFQKDLCLHRGPKALTSFEAESEAAKAQEELDAEADSASRMAAKADEADRSAGDPDEIARQEQHLPKNAIPSRVLLVRCAHRAPAATSTRMDQVSLPLCRASAWGKQEALGIFRCDLIERHDVLFAQAALPAISKYQAGREARMLGPASCRPRIVCNSMANNCPFCPACECPECPKKCEPCLKRPPNDPPTVVLGQDGEPHATNGGPENPLVQAINDDVKAHA